MNSYFVTHCRIQENQGTVSTTVIAVYKTYAWNLDELEAWARKNIPSQPTLEFFKYARQPPRGAEVKEIQ